jgi:hypothetical protein
MPEPMDLPEIITALNAYVASDKAKAKEVAKALRSDARDVAQALINVGAGQKAGEIGSKVDELQQQVTDLTGQLEAKETELTDLKAKTPDAAVLEESAKKKWEPKVKAATERAETAEQRARSLVKEVAKGKFRALLKQPNEQGLKVDDGWADRVVAAEFDDRFKVNDDHSLTILQPGETTAYDGDTEDERIAALAKDARKSVPSAYLVSNADGGSGVRNGGGGSVGLKTQQQIIDAKRNDPAFAGL